MAPQDSTSTPQQEKSETTVADGEQREESVASAETATRFIGQWNKLVSTTNWEKGRIICDWREALMAEGAAVTEYSDEAWAQLVGGVTSQHVGRLRRVNQRFGKEFEQYAGLFWSHFQASLDWDDAEMWLEGSIQNGWSVSQMRGKRWETHGTPPEEQKQETDLDNTEMQATAEPPFAEGEAEPTESEAGVAPTTATIDSPSGKSSDEDKSESSGDSPRPETEASEAEVAQPAEKRTRLNVDVESLPDDLAEAFESFKLAIIAHRRENWRDTTAESVLECLDALRQLATADEEA
ncbi:MAG: hypothetical protein GXP26_00065 [Planctomycetes bacterium]|nr:hypothetical protein [Planctomycetota bacterium]